MKFNQFVLLKENDIAAEIEDIFQQTSKDIDKMFADLYQGTANMVRTAQGTSSGGAKLPTQFLTDILNDLKQIAGKVKDAARAGSPSDKPAHSTTDPRLPRSENVMVDTYLKDVWESVSDVVSGLGSKGQSTEGKGIYDFKSALTNVRQKVMERMGQLRASVLKAMGVVTNMQGQVGKIGKGMGGLKKGIAGLPDAMQARQANPLLGADQLKTADYMVKQLYSIPDEIGFTGQVFLVPDKKGARGEKIDVQDELGQDQVIKSAQKHGRIMKVKYTAPGNNKAIDTGLSLDLGSDNEGNISKVKQYMMRLMKNSPAPKFDRGPKTVIPPDGPLTQRDIPGTT